MADVLTPEQRRLNMSRVRSRDTKPEQLVRRVIHRRGLRFRLQRRDLPGRPDLVLPRHRAVVFVHGCFWHGHDCPLFKIPSSRPEFWQRKINSNRARDKAASEGLASLAWRRFYVWECALKGPGRLSSEELSDRLESFIRGGENFGEIRGSRIDSAGATSS